MAVGKQLHLRLFLEGVEIPVISAQVSINTNAPATAAVQILPLDEGMRLKPRTMVHLFFLDTAANKNSDGAVSGLSKDYRLLFTGEVVGFSVVQTPQSRGLVLQCLDFSNYWDSAHVSAIEYGPYGNAFTDHGNLAAGDDSSTFDDIVNHVPEKMLSWISQKPQTAGLQNISGLAGGVIRIMEAMGGVPNHSKGVNDFFTIAELRCRLLQQITAEENDNTAKRILNEKVLNEWLANGLQNISQQVTFRDVMKLLFEYIYYEFVPNPTARFTPEVEGKQTQDFKKLPLNQSPSALHAKSLLDDAVSVLDHVASGQFDGNEDAITNTVEDVLINCQKAKVELKRLSEKTPKYTKVISEITGIIDQAVTSINSTKAASKSDEGKGYGSGSSAMSKAIEKIKTTEVEVQQPGAIHSTAQSQRLRSQIIRPDCWFVAPPRCNVIFPEMYSQFSYDRNWTTECTRSMIQIYDELVGKDQLFATRILAPNVGANAKSLTRYVGTSSYRVLMDHELHTGIIPRSEWLPNTASVGASASDSDVSDARNSRNSWATRAALFHFFKYRFAPRQASVGGRFNPYVVCGFPGVIITKPFNVKSKTGILNDTSQDTINDIMSKAGSPEFNAPTHFVGMISGVMHSVDQSGGSTSVSMHHVRQHMGVDDDFLDIFIQEQAKKVTKNVKFVFSFDDIAKFPKDPSIKKFLVGATPHSGDKKPGTKQTKKTSTKTSTVTKQVVTPGVGVEDESTQTSHQVVEETTQVEKPPPALTARGKIQGIDRKLLVPSPYGQINVGSKGPNGGTITGIEVVDATLVIIDGKRAYRSIAIYEDVDLKVSGSFPIENAIRPTWFSNAYSNSKISEKIYQPFFGCGSVVDELLIAGFGSGEVSSDGDVGADGTAYTPKDLGLIINNLESNEAKRNEVSIEKALNFLGYIYGQVRSQSMDVEDFIYSYNFREIASMEDMLGDPDLSFIVNGNKVSVRPTAEGVTPSIGFHSLALNETLINSSTPLLGLVEDPTTQLNRLNFDGKTSEVPKTYDVRKAKLDRVKNYLNALTTRGFRG